MRGPGSSLTVQVTARSHCRPRSKDAESMGLLDSDHDNHTVAVVG
jgi:hypothetical protein